MDETLAVATAPQPPETVPIPVPKAPLKPQTLGSVFTITCDKEVVGELKFDVDENLMRGCIKPLRRKLCRKMGMERRVFNVVILTIMNQYTKSGFFFGSFYHWGRKWGFEEVNFATPAKKKTA